MSVNAKMTAIADEIRAKTGGTEPLTLDDMAENVPKVYESGQENIKAQVEPLNSELEKCLAGEAVEGKTWYDKFWDAIQNNGGMANYEQRFWNFPVGIYEPKYDFVFTNGTNYAANGTFRWCQIMDLKRNCDFTKMLDSSVGLMYTFLDMPKLVNARTLKVKETNKYTNPFGGCYALEEIRFDGAIGQNGLDFKACSKLSKQSIESIVSHLSANTTGLTVTLSKTAVTNAFGGVDSAEWTALIATKSNWTISLV